MDDGSRSASIIVIAVIIVIISVTAFALWWRRDTIFPTSEGTEEVVVIDTLDKNQLDNSIKQLFRYNDMEVSDDELQPVSADNNSISIAHDLTPVVNNYTTSKVVVSAADQNLLYIPAPSLVTVVMNGLTIPMLFIRADEATVIAYNPMNSRIVSYPYTSFSKSYDEAGRQCVLITDRGYSGY